MSEQTRINIVQASHLVKQVQSPEGPLTILDDITLNIEAGKTVAITGASGSGKSTLLSILASLDVPSSGQVHLLGKNINELDEDNRAKLRAGSVGFVFQSFHLLPNMTALENVLLPLELDNDPDADTKAKQVLDLVGLSKRTRHYPNQLSGGEQQRVAIARAYSITPKILFADEPTGNLDQATGSKIIDLLFELHANSSTTLVMVTHDANLSPHCDYHFEMSAGKLSV